MVKDPELQYKVEQLCLGLNLGPLFWMVLRDNPSNNLPYHNWYHILCMVDNVIAGGQYHNLPFRSLQHLAVAALFHDFNHSGGTEPDSTNIVRAIQSTDGFMDDYETTYEKTYERNYKSYSQMEVIQYIRATEYPYVVDCLSIEQKILRDADLMQGLRPFWKEMLIDGLGEEMSIRLGRTLTLEEMVEGQIKFIEAIKPNSDWGKYVLESRCGKHTMIRNLKTLLPKVTEPEEKYEGNIISG